MMKLTKFRTQDYRSIHDSDWVDIDDIAVIVGKNESGKTSLLKALWKLNPFHDARRVIKPRNA
jgi:AAA15 family ATPase/GTPase